MTSFPPVRRETNELISTLPISKDVSWAGPSDLEDSEFCFGLEDGTVIFTNSDGDRIVYRLNNASPSGEAINGVAFYQNWISVSTRQEVTQWHIDKVKVLGAIFPIGAHGVVAGSNGFFAPVGPAGIMFAPTTNETQDVTIFSPSSEQIYIYRLCSLQMSSGTQFIACAARHHGVASMEFLPQHHECNLSTFAFDNLDVVDVCPLSIENKATAVAALGKNGTIALFREVSNDSKPETTKYNTIEGTAYRILAVRDFLFVLTSRGLYVVANLIEHFASESSDVPDVKILVVPFEAVDINVVDDRWVLVVLPNEVLRIDVDLLDSEKNQSNSQPNWREEFVSISEPILKIRHLKQCASPMSVGA